MAQPCRRIIGMARRGQTLLLIDQRGELSHYCVCSLPTVRSFAGGGGDGGDVRPSKGLRSRVVRLVEVRAPPVDLIAVKITGA
jgi:hypothetical protein